MDEFWTWMSSSAGNVLLAILAGAGGSALLELFWRPRRDRKRAASLFVAEVALNTELLLLQAHARTTNPFGIPADLRMSTIAWESAADLISELPAEMVRALVQLYNQYHSLNRQIDGFGGYLDAFKAAPSGSSEERDAETMVLRVIDVFNTGLDATLRNGQTVLPDLIKFSGMDAEKDKQAPVPNYRDVALEHMANRKLHLEALKSAAAARAKLPDGSA